MKHGSHTKGELKMPMKGKMTEKEMAAHMKAMKGKK